jgi:cephalosporin-C deacetylase-like acetyl esterase
MRNRGVCEIAIAMLALIGCANSAEESAKPSEAALKKPEPKNAKSMLTFNAYVDGYYDVGNQMFEYMKRRADRAFRARDEERAKITTREQFEAQRAKMKENFLREIGGLPTERTPLNAAITGTIDQQKYTIENLIYYSVPDFPVTAALYLPKGEKKPRPAVVFVCGHAEEAKAHPGYQKVCIDLALNGFVVLAIDPVGQGERMQFLDEQSGKQKVNWGTTEHTYAGIPCYAAGMSIARWFVWDAMRALDYLETRPEVDAKKIGITGNSGGGNQSAFMMIADPRLAAAMPCTWITDYESYMKNGQPQDAEQNLYASFVDGPDHDDFIAAMAPKSVRLGLAAYDFFCIEGALASEERARKMYALYGNDAAKNLDHAIAPTTHTYGAHLRCAAVNFFRRALYGDATEIAPNEPEPLPVKDLNATKSGQVLLDFPKCKTVSDLLSAEVAKLPEPKKREASALRTEVSEALGIGAFDSNASYIGPSRERTIYPRIIKNEPVDGHRVEKIFFFSEPDVCVSAIYLHPSDETKATGTEILLLPEGTNATPAEMPRISQLLEQNKRVFVFDVRGIGGVKQRSVTVYEHPTKYETEFRLAMDAMKLKTSTLGLRVFDVLRAYDYLKTRADAGPVSVTGVGVAGTWALYAAALEPEIKALTLERTPLSYRAFAQTRFYDDSIFNMRTTAFGIFKSGDVADLLAAIAPRAMTIVSPVGATGAALEKSQIESGFLKSAENAGLIGEKAGGWRPQVR